MNSKINNLIIDLENLLIEEMSCSKFKEKYYSRNFNWEDLPDIIGNISHFLDDEDLRLKNSDYRTMQRGELSKLIQMLKDNQSEKKLKEISFLEKTK